MCGLRAEVRPFCAAAQLGEDEGKSVEVTWAVLRGGWVPAPQMSPALPLGLLVGPDGLRRRDRGGCIDWMAVDCGWFEMAAARLSAPCWGLFLGCGLWVVGRVVLLRDSLPAVR